MAFTGVNLPKLVESSTPNRSDRQTTKVDLFVIHDTEGSYQGAVSWLKNPKAQASAHVVLREDGLEATQLVGWNEKAWSCVDFNGRSENLELAGYASKSLAGYASKSYPLRQLRSAARITAFRLRRRNLKPNHVQPLRGQHGGWCYHSDLGVPGGGHHDPSFSKTQNLLFTALVKYEFYRSGFRWSWGYDILPG
jgi:hypothetical protein